jgi:hypothetical protein
MGIHQNARTTPHSRAELVRRVTAEEAPRLVAAGPISAIPSCKMDKNQPIS